MSRYQRFLELNRKLNDLRLRRPVLFNLISLGIGLLFGGLVSALLCLVQR